MIAPSQDFRLRRAWRNFTAGFLTGYGFVSFFCFIFLEQRWAALAPRAPNMTLGLIYQHNDHGTYTYFSSFQATACTLMFMTSISLAAVGMHIAPKKNVKFSASKFSARWTYDADDPAAILWKAALVAACLTPAFVFIVGPRMIRMLNAIGVVLNMG